MATRSDLCPRLEHEWIAMREDFESESLFLYCQRCASYKRSRLMPETPIPDAFKDALKDDSK